MKALQNLWKMNVALWAFLCTLMAGQAQAQSWEFDTENPVSAGSLRYALDQQRLAAQCIGLVEGQEGAATLTVPATMSSGGRTYQVVSIADGAFLKAAALTEARLESMQLQVGSIVFTTALQHLYLSATTPPDLDYYLIVDPENPLSVLSQSVMTRIHVPKGTARAYLQNEWWALYMLTEGDDLTLTIATQRTGTVADYLRTHDIVPQLVNHLTVSGPLNDDDWHFIGDSLPNLLTLDMQEAQTAWLPKSCFNRSKLSSILLPRSLKRIGTTAFSGLQRLEQLVIPEGVEQLEGSGSTSATFFNCPNLKLVELPSTLMQVAGSLIYRVAWGEGAEPPITIVCHAFFPPVVGSRVLLDAMYAGPEVTLRVPAMSAGLYAADSKWNGLSLQTEDHQPAVMQVYTPRTLDTGVLPTGYQPDLHMGTLVTQNYSYRSDSFGSLIVSGQQSFSTGAVTLYADLTNDRASAYHYCTPLVLQAPMTARQVTVDMRVNDGRWFFLSFPFDVKLADVVTDSNIRHWVVRQYSSRNRARMQGDQWIDVPYGATLKANQGYIWRFATTDDADAWESNGLKLIVSPVAGSQNQLFATSDVKVPLAEQAATYPHNASWNLVGNPFPCYYDSRQLWPAVPFTVWNHSYQEYRTYSPQDDSYELSPYEAFFLQKPANASELTFSAAGRAGLGSSAREKVADQGAANSRMVVNLVLSSDSLADRTRLVLNAQALAGYESGRDAAKFFNPDAQRPQLYSLVGQACCAINERPEGEGTVSLGVKTAAQQACTIALDGTAPLPVLLEDRLNGSLTDLARQPYDFLSRPGSDDTRFVLHVGATATGISSAASPMQPPTPAAFNLQGQPVGCGYRGLVIENGKLTIKR